MTLILADCRRFPHHQISAQKIQRDLKLVGTRRGSVLYRRVRSRLLVIATHRTVQSFGVKGKSNMNIIKKGIFILLLFVIHYPAHADRAILDGFEWAGTGPGKCEFLKPEGWFLRTEELKGTYGVFITKEKIEKGKNFKTGFSLNVVKNIKAKTGATASQYALAFVLQSTKNKEIVKKPWSFNNEPFKCYGVQVKDNAKVIHYMLLANTKTDTLFVTFFESPPNKWIEAWGIGNVILNNMKIDSFL